MENQPIKVEGVQVFAWAGPGSWEPPQEPNEKHHCIQWRQYGFKNEQDFSSAIATMRSVKENDLIWIRTSKFNYLSRVKSNRHNNSFEAFESATIVPMVDVYDFIKIGYWVELPGFVQWQTDHPAATFKRIEDIEKITTAIYNSFKGEDIYETKSFSRIDWFTKMLSPYQDIEDIVGLYLQHEKDYLIFNETYRQWYLGGEGCFMVKKDGSHKCYFHVLLDEYFRNLLNEDDFIRLTENGKNYVYLFATDPKFIKEYDNEKIIYLDADEILNFTKTHEYLLPERMKQWLHYVTTP